MSAKNWKECPRCIQLAAHRQGQLVHDAAKAYGKVAPEEYAKMISDASKASELDETLREDWEIGVGDDGKFRVGYRCRCEACGLNFSFEHEESCLARNP